jgi:hypothetical protein
MTLVFIENIFGGSQVITILETFGDDVVEHRLAPGENLKIAASRFKSIVINEAPANPTPRRPAMRGDRLVAMGAAS